MAILDVRYIDLMIEKSSSPTEAELWRKVKLLEGGEILFLLYSAIQETTSYETTVAGRIGGILENIKNLGEKIPELRIAHAFATYLVDQIKTSNGFDRLQYIHSLMTFNHWMSEHMKVEQE